MPAASAEAATASAGLATGAGGVDGAVQVDDDWDENLESAAKARRKSDAMREDVAMEDAEQSHQQLQRQPAASAPRFSRDKLFDAVRAHASVQGAAPTSTGRRDGGENDRGRGMGKQTGGAPRRERSRSPRSDATSVARSAVAEMAQ